MRRIGILLCLLAAPTVAGCAMCCGVDDENYGAYGGIWQRVDMRNGRVGSAFTPVGARATIEDSSVIVSDAEVVSPSTDAAPSTSDDAVEEYYLPEGELEEAWYLE